MTLFLLDTDHVSLYQRGHPRLIRNLLLHLNDQLAVSVITVEEQLAGWRSELSRARDNARRADFYARMAQATESLASWRVIPFSLTAMTRHADLMRQRLNVGSNDLKIAASALEVGAVVVTRNARDFGRVPGLPQQDWSV